MTRADLSKKMNTSKPTVSKNVDALIRENKVLEIGKDDNLIGKKGILLDINAAYGYVLALDLSKNQFRAVLSDLKYQWLASTKMPLDLFFADGEGGVDVVSFLKDFLKESSVSLDHILTVTMAYSGVVGHNDELYLTNMAYKEILLNQLKPFIKEALKKPLTIKNDINLAVIAEKRFGCHGDLKNMYLFSGDVGVGAGIIINHQLYEGDRYAAGEVGFILPVQNRNHKYCTIEEKVSINALTERYREAVDFSASFEDLVSGVSDGEAEADAIYRDVLQDLAVTITNIASILDIKKIIVTGRLFNLKASMIDDLNRCITEMTPFETVVVKSRLDRMALRGAVAVGVEKVVNKLID